MTKSPISNDNKPDNTARAYDPDGCLTRDEQGRLTLTFKRYYPHSLPQVWAAITDPKQNQNWLGKFWFEPKVGGKLSMILDGTDPVNGTPTTGTVLSYSPPHILEYQIDALEKGALRVEPHINRWALSEAPDGCLVEFTHVFTGGERAQHSIASGWHSMLEQFETTVAGHTTDWSTYNGDRMTALYSHYKNKAQI